MKPRRIHSTQKLESTSAIYYTYAEKYQKKVIGLGSVQSKNSVVKRLKKYTLIHSSLGNASRVEGCMKLSDEELRLKLIEILKDNGYPTFILVGTSEKNPDALIFACNGPIREIVSLCESAGAVMATKTVREKISEYTKRDD